MPMGRSPVAGRTRKEASGRNWPQPGKQHDIAQEFHAAGFAAVLIVDFAVHVIGIRQLDQPRGGFECTVGPGLEAQAGGKRRAAELGVGERQQHELPRVQLEILREENGIELGAEGHQLRFDSFQARRSVQRGYHFGYERAREGSCEKLRRNEQSADEPLVIFQDVEAVSGGIAIFHRHVAAQRAGIDEPANQFNRRAVIPM